MKWDEQLIKACTETDGTPHPHTDHVLSGAKWQRDQLRTDEAVERVADWLCEEDHGYTLAGHGEWCQDLACDLVESYRESARAAITALLGEET